MIIHSLRHPIPGRKYWRPLAAAAALMFMLAGCGGDEPGASLPHAPDKDKKRFMPNAEFFKYQWHLQNTGQPGAPNSILHGVAGIDLNVLPVWAQKDDQGRDIIGTGVTVAVVDGGLDIRHQNLNIASGLSHNYVTGSDDPTPSDPNDKHGTRLAGIIAAKKDMRVIGVAPGAKLAGFNYKAVQSSVNLMDALSRGVDDGSIDISNNSRGLNNGTIVNISHAEPLRVATSNGVNEGRNGKGVIYLFSAGNARSGERNVYKEEGPGYSWTNFRSSREPQVLTVCAVDADGMSSYYSNIGSNILVCAPSSGDKTTPRITTTDLNNSYTHESGGTSAATAMVSGVVALMLQANPDLSWRDIRLILPRTALITKSMELDPDAGWIEMPNPAINSYTGESYRYSLKYGFGLVNAAEAVAYAKKLKSDPENFPSVGGSSIEWWETGGYTTGGKLRKPIEISKEANTEIKLPLSSDKDKKVEFVEFLVRVKHDRFRDLSMMLITPSGTRIPLTDYYPYCGAYAKDPKQNNNCPTSEFGDVYSTSVTAALDEPINGDWVFQVKDYGNASQGTIKSVKLIVH